MLSNTSMFFDIGEGVSGLFGLIESVCGGCLESLEILFSTLLVDETCGWL